MQPTGELRVPRRIVRVEVTLRGLPAQRGNVFLAPDAPDAWQRDDVAGLLEGPPFFAFHAEGEPGKQLIARDSCVIVEVEPLTEGPPVLYDQEVELEIELAVDGQRHVRRGVLLYSAPLERARLIDRLNVEDRFIRLVAGEVICFVHKRFVARVRQLAQGG